MTEEVIKHRLNRIYVAFEARAPKLEDIAPRVDHHSDGSWTMTHDLGTNRSQAALEVAANAILTEIIGIEDRTRNLLDARGDDRNKVTQFIKSQFSVALVHDLSNTDKHDVLTRQPLSGCRPILGEVSQGLTLQYDPATGSYASSGEFIGGAVDTWTGQVVSKPTSTGLEMTLCADVFDENGSKVGEFQRIVPDTIHAWETFLTSLGVAK